MKRNKPRTLKSDDEYADEMTVPNMAGSFGPTLSSKSSPPKALFAVAAQRNHVHQMVQEAKV